MLPNDTLPPADSSASDLLLDEIYAMLREAMRKGNNLISRVEAGNVRVGKPLLKAENIFPSFKQHLLMAEDEILFEGYKIDGGSDAEKDFLDALAELSKKAKQQGKRIRVKLLINRKGYLASLVKSNQSNAFRSGVEYENLDIEYVEHLHQAFGSYHAKLIIIDGKIAIMPSAELLSVSNYKDGQSRQVDVASFMYGREFVNFLRQEFIEAWNNDSCVPLKGNKSVIPAQQAEAGTAEFQQAIQTKAIYFVKRENGSILERNYLSPFALALTHAIRKAKHCINIMTPNLNEEEIIYALADAHQSGTKINLVMGKHMNDSGESKPLMGGTNQDAIKRLFAEIARRGGDPFKNIEVRWATDVTGTTIIPHPHPNSVHARMVCIDDMVFIGSSVCDKQSVYHSREADAIYSSAALADLYMQEIFTPVFSKAINVFLDPLNEIKVSVPAQVELNKMRILYELIELRKTKNAALESNWSAIKSIFPGGRVFALEQMRIKLTEKLINDIMKEDDLAAIKSLMTECVLENKRLTRQLMLNEPMEKSVEMKILGESKTDDKEAVDVFEKEELGALHRLLFKYVDTQGLHPRVQQTFTLMS